MTKTKQSLWLVKPGMEQKLRDWLTHLNTKARKRALATLKYENVVQERAYVFSVGSETYLLYTMDFKEPRRPMHMGLKINQEHQRILDATIRASLIPVELLLSLSR